jgi:hypothetical protein
VEDGRCYDTDGINMINEVEVMVEDADLVAGGDRVRPGGVGVNYADQLNVGQS